ncbi:MAG: hypothetical protein ACFFAT_02015 [Promethearchaeota archaeon]
MSEQNYQPLRKLLNESLIMEIVLFLLLFILNISQEWSNILLMLFPLITFSFSLFFKMIGINKWRIQHANTPIIYNPLGAEKIHSSRLFFCSIIQLILLYWLGAESLYRPQLIGLYSIFFIPIYFFTYTFGYYWIFIDLWKYSKISIFISQNDLSEIISDYKTIRNDFKEVFSKLKIKSFKIISIGSLIVFISVNLINLVFTLLQLIGLNFGFFYILPGTGIESSEPMMIPYFIFIILIASPISAILFLLLSYRDLKGLNLTRIQKLIAPLPENIQLMIKRNLKLLDKKLKEYLNIN